MSDGPVHASGRGQGRSVRFRLLAIALLPTLVILPLLLGMAVYRWNAKFDAALTSKVNGDLTIAHQYFARILENTGEQLVALGQSARFRDVAGQPQVLSALLEENRERLELDFLYLVTANGNLQASAPALAGSPRQDWPIIVHALEGEASTGVDIFSPQDLEAISMDLARRAELELVPTTNAVPTDRNTETRGMVVHSASPVQLADGRSAALVGGILLNRNLVFIDTINDLVYREASLPEGSQGDRKSVV